MRQRALPHQHQEQPVTASLRKGGQQISQRRLVGREPAASWEISSEYVEMPDDAPTLSNTHSSTNVRFATHEEHFRYQNGELLANHVAQSNNAMKFKTASMKNKPNLNEFHVMYRRPLHVPDNRYQEFLLGKRTRRKEIPLVTKLCLAQTFAAFSIIAIGFLVFVGILLDTQPLYIKGTLIEELARNEETGKLYTRYTIPDTRLPAASVAYHTAALYTLILIACIYIMHPGHFHKMISRRNQHYQDIPDHVNIAETNLLYPSGGDDGYPQPWLHHADIRIKHWLAARGWYNPTRRPRKNVTPKCV